MFSSKTIYDRKKCFCCFFLFLFFTAIHAQTIIKGKVVDASSQQPLEAVTVMDAKDTTIATLTDFYGNYALKVSNDTTTLLISYIGFKPATVPVTHAKNLKVVLQPDAINLKDLVLQANRLSKFSTLAKIDLDLKPVRSTQELLRLVPGLFIAQHAGGGKAEQIFLRGFDCDHGTDVQVSVDGMPVNMVSHAHGQGYADAHFIIPETINNIDFGAGPYYTQHGNLNTAGYVSFSTYTNIDKSKVQLEAGRFDTYRALAMIDLLKKNKDRQSAYIATEYYYTNGPTLHPQNFHRYNIFGKYNAAITPNTQLIASLSSFSSNWNASGQIPERAVSGGLIDRFGSIDPTEGGNTERHNANVILVHTFSGGTTWENQAYYSRNRFSLYSDFSFFLNDTIHGDEINQAEKRNVVGYLSRLTQKHILAKGSLQSIYGIGVRYDVTTDSKLAHVVKRQFVSNIQLGDIKEANVFSYIQQQLHLHKWFVDAGVRLDYLHFNYFDKLHAQKPAQAKAIISPKLNIQYTLNPQMQLFVKAGKGFHSNDTRVVVANEGKEILPAAYGADAGFILKPNSRLLINMAAWYLYLNQEFVYVGDDGHIEPSGKTQRKGVDMIVRYQFSENLFATVNVNLTNPRYLAAAKGKNYIPLAPTATSTGGLFYKKKEGLNGGLSYRYIKSRPANEDNSIIAKGYFLMDGSVNYTKKSYELGLALENLFNATWNEAQFATEARLKGEPYPVDELNYTPGTPFFIRAKIAVMF